MKVKTAKKNQSLEKALQIIETMAKEKAPMRLLDISEKLSLPASTILRFLNTLMAYNYVNQDPETLKYSLSVKFCQI
jgi:DNA-binding IclR family transcriptional regulator